LFLTYPFTLKPKPFVKWAGGKRQLVNVLLFNVPKSFNRYFEPFVGGGALLFELQPMKAIISDINEELINAYNIIKDNVEELISSLRKHRNTAKHYYAIRSLDPKVLTPVERASRFIFRGREDPFREGGDKSPQVRKHLEFEQF